MITREDLNIMSKDELIDMIEMLWRPRPWRNGFCIHGHNILISGAVYSYIRTPGKVEHICGECKEISTQKHYKNNKERILFRHKVREAGKKL